MRSTGSARPAGHPIRRVFAEIGSLCTLTHMHLYAYCQASADGQDGGLALVALGDAILACLTERPMTGYELAKTFDTSIGFFWKANHQQIYRELTKLRDRGHIQGREVVQSGKPNKLVYTLTPEGRAALRHWGARPSSAGFDQGRSAGAALRARQRRHRAVARRPDGAAGIPPRPLLPATSAFSTNGSLTAPPRRQISASCWRFASAFATSAPWRSGAKRRSIPCRRRARSQAASRRSTAAGAASRDDRRVLTAAATPGRIVVEVPASGGFGCPRSGQFHRPANFPDRPAHSLTRYLP